VRADGDGAEVEGAVVLQDVHKMAIESTKVIRRRILIVKS
jgi:hypothetical protein